MASEDPVIEVGEGLPNVALEPGSLAPGRRPPRRRRVALDSEIAGHPLDPEVVPRIRYEEGRVEVVRPHEPGRRLKALVGVVPQRLGPYRGGRKPVRDEVVASGGGLRRGV